MENASKALIIAGAILLSILIIALGIYVFNMAKNATNTDALDELAINTFNANFESYAGKQIGNQVKTLLSNVISSAGTNQNSDERLPDITYIDWNGSKSTGPVFNIGSISNFGRSAGGSNIISDVSNTNIAAIQTLSSKIANTHQYTVEFGKSNEGIINQITISY